MKVQVTTDANAVVSVRRRSDGVLVGTVRRPASGETITLDVKDSQRVQVRRSADDEAPSAASE